MSASFGVPSVVLDTTQMQPLVRQIQAQIGRAVRVGELAGGTRLPSSRLMAKLLGVSRSTVVGAYEALLEEGLIEAKAGSGVRVRHAGGMAAPIFMSLRRAARAAHLPARILGFEDPDGSPLYLNVTC